MTRIIKHGSEWGHKKEDWYGRTVECKACGCQFVLDRDVNFSVYTGGKPGVSYIQCPECGSTTGVKLIKWI